MGSGHPAYPSPVTEPAVPGGRVSGIAPYVVGVALGSTAYIAAFTAAGLAAREISGSAQLAGLPGALGIVGTAIAIGVLSVLMARRGRRAGLIAGYVAGIAGGAASVAAVAAGSLPLLLLGSLAIGFANAAVQLSRYAAADAVVPHHRARAVGIVVWGSTFGAVLGPNLMQPAGTVAEAVGRTPLEGGLTVTVVGFALALLVTLGRRRRLPAAAVPGASGAWGAPSAAPVADPEHATALARGLGVGAGRFAVLASTRVRIALVGLVTGQVVMVLIMAMTPVHVHDLGHPLTTVGLVISAHTLGMFALSPLSGRLVERFGPILILLAGFAVLLLAAILAAVARESDIPVLTLALFLLGYGWNLGFVAGSALLTAGAGYVERVRLQGMTDVVVWSSSAVASISSGFLLDLAGYQALAIVGGALLAIPAVTIAVARRRLLPELGPAGT